MSAYWQVKNGGNATPQTFRTLKAAREYAQVLNAACGYSFTIISKVNKPSKTDRTERDLAESFAR